MTDGNKQKNKWKINMQKLKTIVHDEISGEAFQNRIKLERKKEKESKQERKKERKKERKWINIKNWWVERRKSSNRQEKNQE